MSSTSRRSANAGCPRTDLDWTNGLGELPEEVERAVGQLATVYSSHGLVEQKIIAKWFESISYGFHDVKLFLGTQVYDAGHKVEALRKRALANGGGLGQAPLGTLYRGWYGALKFTEMIIALDVVYKSFETHLSSKPAPDFARRTSKRSCIALMARDSRRHLEYGSATCSGTSSTTRAASRTSNSGSAEAEGTLFDRTAPQPRRTRSARGPPARSAWRSCRRASISSAPPEAARRLHRPARRAWARPAAIAERRFAGDHGGSAGGLGRLGLTSTLQSSGARSTNSGPPRLLALGFLRLRLAVAVLLCLSLLSSFVIFTIG